MTEIQNSKRFDLEDRTLNYTRSVSRYCKTLPKSVSHYEFGKQLVRSAGSVGANYIEANEALSKKDFIMRVKICRKEAKERRYWLELTEPDQREFESRKKLIQESTELMKIFGAILEKSK
ncbi:MAG: four helix bundle protein [Patescibacteria group bacterium]